MTLCKVTRFFFPLQNKRKERTNISSTFTSKYISWFMARLEVIQLPVRAIAEVITPSLIGHLPPEYIIV